MGQYIWTGYDQFVVSIRPTHSTRNFAHLQNHHLLHDSPFDHLAVATLSLVQFSSGLSNHMLRRSFMWAYRNLLRGR